MDVWHCVHLSTEHTQTTKRLCPSSGITVRHFRLNVHVNDLHFAVLKRFV